MTYKDTVIFIDSGDTIIDEGTEIRDGEIVVSAETVPGACETLKKLYDDGYKIVLVADGYYQSFKNMFIQNGIFEYFYAFVVSELLNVCKPDARMFKCALGAAGLDSCDVDKAIMIGNNLARDIKGANEMNIASVHYKWSPRYEHTPSDESETPRYVITEFSQIADVIKQFENESAK